MSRNHCHRCGARPPTYGHAPWCHQLAELEERIAQLERRELRAERELEEPTATIH